MGRTHAFVKIDYGYFRVVTTVKFLIIFYRNLFDILRVHIYADVKHFKSNVLNNSHVRGAPFRIVSPKGSLAKYTNIFFCIRILF